MQENIKKSLLKGTLLTSGGQVLSVIFLFISNIILTRYFNQETVGLFFLMMAVWMFLQMVGGLGLDAALVKFFTSENKETKSLILNELLILRIASLLIVSLLFFFTSKLFIIINEAVNKYSLLIIIIFFLDSLRNFFNAELQATKQFKEYIIVQVILTISKLFIYIILIFVNNLSLINLLLAEVFSMVISFLIQQRLTSIKILNINKIRMNEFLRILKFSFPLYLNNLLGVFSNRINSIIIGTFLNVIDIAYYEIGKKIPDGFGRLATSITLVYYPFISELFSNNNIEEAKQLTHKYVKIITLVALPILLISFIFNVEIISLLFSKKYVKSSFAFSIFTFSFYFSLISTMFGYTTVAAGKPDLSFKVNLIKTIIFLILTLVFTPVFGFMGAVYSIFISSIGGFILSIYALNSISLSISVKILFYPILVLIPFILANFLSEIYGYNNIYFSIILILLLIIVEYFIFEEFKEILYYIMNKIYIKFNNILRGRGLSEPK